MARQPNQVEAKIDEKIKREIYSLFVLPSFKNQIRLLRKDFDIPKKGYDITIFDKLALKDKTPRIPNEIKNKKKYKQKIKELLRYYGLSIAWFDFISDYVLFNFINDTEEDLNQIMLLNLGLKNKHLKKEQKKLEESLDSNPVVLAIPAHASEREIIDFIYKNTEKIKRIQKPYKFAGAVLSNKKRKNMKVKERNNFIYKNRHLPKNKLVSKVADLYGDILDYTYINKIISQEKLAKKKKKSAGI